MFTSIEKQSRFHEGTDRIKIMTGFELIDLMERSGRRPHVIGTTENGIIAGLDLEGRLFAVMNGDVLNRVTPSAILEHSSKETFLNSGGDILWPAPEGNCFGYQYSTGNWCVASSITTARWELVSSDQNEAVIRAEIDLINNNQLGIPCEFERHVKVNFVNNVLIQEVKELIRYTGSKVLTNNEFRLVPWSICQLNSQDGEKITIPPPAETDIWDWDLYGSSKKNRGMRDGEYVIDTNTKNRFQLGLSENILWIDYSNKNLSVRRYKGVVADGQPYIDISDISPKGMPSNRGVNLSIYYDPSGIVELEVCGGCPPTLSPGDETSVSIITEYKPIITSE